MDWLGERTHTRIATMKTSGVSTKYFNPNDFEHTLAATSDLASFQSTFFGVRKMKLLLKLKDILAESQMQTAGKLPCHD